MALTFNEWRIREQLDVDVEFLLKENIISLKNFGGQQTELAPMKIYNVADYDQATNVIVLTDDDGNRYKFDKDELSKSIANGVSENDIHGFQAAQYPLAHLVSHSPENLPYLAMYDKRVAKMAHKGGKKGKK